MFLEFDGTIYLIKDKGKEMKALYDKKIEKDKSEKNKVNSNQKVKKLGRSYK